MRPVVRLTDAGWMADTATAGGRVAAGRWPRQIPTAYSKEQMEDSIRVALRPKPGHHIYPDPQQRGFFIVRPGRLPLVGIVAPELVIWFTKLGLSEREYREVLSGLFTDWFEDELARGEYEWAFGIMPVGMPEKSQRYLDAWVKAGGVEVKEFAEPDGSRWLRYYGPVKRVLERLPRWPPY